MILPILAFCLLMSACSRNGNGPTKYKVKTQVNYQLGSNGDTLLVSYYFNIYDNQGRLSQQLSTVSNTSLSMNALAYVDTFTSNYTSNSIKVFNGNTLVYSWSLNSLGRIVSDADDVFAYNSNGYRIADSFMTGNTPSEIIKYTIANGNINIREGFNAAGDSIFQINYTHLNTLEMRDYGTPFWGIDDKNLINTTTQAGYVFTLAYTFDNLGRVTYELHDPRDFSTYTYY